MLCNDVQDSLKPYIDGAMGPEQRGAVEAHLQSCAACRAALERIDRLAAVLLDAKPPPVPTGFASRVMLAAKSRKRATSVAAGNPWQWWFQKVPWESPRQWPKSEIAMVKWGCTRADAALWVQSA